MELTLVASAAVCFSGCTKGQAPSSRAQAPTAVAFGYLSDKAMPDSLTAIPPPPAQNSAAMARDEAVRRAALMLHDTDRYALAADDADRTQDGTDRAFQCAFGVDIDQQQTPILYKLLGKMRIDVRAATYPAKLHYRRVRPWVANNAQVCSASEQLVRNDGSYPSARGAVGWAYALVLARLNPSRSSLILERGRAFGESRIVCDAEWQSDVDAGRTMAEAVVSRLLTVDQFRADFAAARQEVVRSLKNSKKPADCASEMRALAQR
ncbi:phosphatase PAP2 family protein [Sphingomonas sp. RG327]|uniref:Acid phosphatase n=1 Tax=Sphingomonas anseongensis TaxID=2908207 RepID=A0ABT0RG21_9SPHN|nr:phosphatase PAP2 family protein [Sphingomonas anseongensis]MCL6679183.1 phosphatase PAP2 family protein [Sphingomonas anseongensis]